MIVSVNRKWGEYLDTELILGIVIFLFIPLLTMFYFVYKGRKTILNFGEDLNKITEEEISKNKFEVAICPKCGSPKVFNDKSLTGMARISLIPTCEDCGYQGIIPVEEFSKEEFEKYIRDLKKDV